MPDSAIPAAIGYAREAGIPYREGLVKNRYVGRTFIQPDQRIREAGVSLKFNALRDVLEGQARRRRRRQHRPRHDDAPRRRPPPQAGATEVHMRITTPPIISPCFFGVDMATTAELIAANKTVEEIRQHIGADSLGFLSLDGLVDADRTRRAQNLCNACFTGKYPASLQMLMEMEARLARSGNSRRALANRTCQPVCDAFGRQLHHEGVAAIGRAPLALPNVVDCQEAARGGIGDALAHARALLTRAPAGWV